MPGPRSRSPSCLRPSPAAWSACCYAELSTLLPVQGSTYTYTYATALGELAAWLIGWDLILEYSMGVAVVACGWSAYFNSLLVQIGMGLPPELLSATGEQIVRADGSPGTPIDALSRLVGAGTLFAFILVCIAVIYLRRAEPHTPRPFRAPWVPWLPMLGILFCLGLLAGLGVYTWVRLGIWIAIGLAIYFLYGRFQSRLRTM